jgi:hypothetical protein
MTNYEGVKAWRKANKAKVAAQVGRYRAKHPDAVAATNKRYRERNLKEIREREKEARRSERIRDPAAEKRRTIKWRNRRELKLALQVGRRRPQLCELCGEFNRWIVCDHCHVGGHFRGWICDRCNKVLGLVYDSVDLLSAMIDYLGAKLEIHPDCVKTQQSTRLCICKPRISLSGDALFPRRSGRNKKT